MRLIRSGKLDRTVTILRCGPSTDDGKQTIQGTLQPLATRSASVKPKMGREVTEAAGREGRTVMSFWMRADSLTVTVTTEDVLQLDGVVYELVAPPIPVGRGDGVEFLAVAGGLPVVTAP